MHTYIHACIHAQTSDRLVSISRQATVLTGPVFLSPWPVFIHQFNIWNFKRITRCDIAKGICFVAPFSYQRFQVCQDLTRLPSKEHLRWQ